MSCYNTILFDADNTLFDFSRAEREAIADTLALCGIAPSEELILAYSRINDAMWKRLERGEITKDALREARFSEFCHQYGLSCDIPKMAASYLSFLSQKRYLIKDAHEVVAALAARYPLYIVTNGIKTVQRGRFSISELRPYFKDIFISEEIGFEKPHIGYFEEVARRIDGFSKRHTLIVGDSLTSDIKGGIATGIDTCWFNPAAKPNKEELPITYEIGALTDLLPLLLA